MKPTLICSVFLVALLHGESVQAQRAGQGTYQPKLLKREGAPADASRLQRGQHYLRVEETSWFVNDAGNILRDRMVSGTVELQLGNENYQVVLGTYALSGGNRIAPLFNRVILENRAYAGGDLRVVVFLKGIKKDTATGNLLRSVANSTLGIAGGTAATVTALGCSPILAGAGRDLLTGVQSLLNGGESAYGIFDEQGGLSFTLHGAELVGYENFLLAYRGNDLTGKRVTVTDNGNGVYDVLVDGDPLRQGAWILFRILRPIAYGNARPWDDKVAKVRDDLDGLMQNWQAGAKTAEQVTTALKPTLQGDAVGDRILAVRSEIRADQVLTENEKALETGRLVALLCLAQTACKADNGYDQYFREKEKLQEDLHNGTAPHSAVAKSALLQEWAVVAKDIPATYIVEPDVGGRVPSSRGPRTKAGPTRGAEPERSSGGVELSTPAWNDELWRRLGEADRAQAAERNQRKPQGSGTVAP